MKTVIQSLNKLQNRGYDSAGVSTICYKNILIKKYVSSSDKNAIECLNTDPISNLVCDLAIGHTRWATHGSKTVENAHPHMDDSYRFALVHNGIIENYNVLREELIQNGYTFYGQTDTEVIVKYLDYLVSNGRKYYELMKIMIGSWAILFIDREESDRIYYMKNGSPLIMGFDVGNSKIMLASEFIAFDSDIKLYSIINDGDFGYVMFNDECNYYSQFTYEKNIVPKLDYETSPHPYSHWTLKEIHDQPQAIRNLLSDRIYNNQIYMPELVNHNINEYNHIILLACGTSYHAAQIGSRFIKEHNPHLTTDVVDGADFEEFDIPIGRKTMMILLSQSGETKDLYRALLIGKNKNIKSIGIINVENSLIAREVDIVLYLKAGRENAVASTKSFTNQVIMLLLLSIKMNNNNHTKYINDINRLSHNFEKIIEQSVNEIPGIINLFENQTNCFVLGKHINEWIAKEGSLKIKEISYLHAEGFSVAALKHGPFALLTDDVPVILLANNDNFFSKIENATAEIKSRKSTVIMVTNKKIKSSHIDHIFYFDTDSALFPLLSIVPLQVLSYYLSLSKGNNPDYPRNLAKVVTVE